MASSSDLDGLRREMGRSLAAFRLAAKLTQHRLAPLINYTRSTVANVEVGRQPAPRGFWVRCDEVLSAGGQLIAMYDHIEEARLSARREGLDLLGTSWGSLEACRQPPSAGPVRRRSLIAAAATLPLGIMESPRPRLGVPDVEELRRRMARLRRLDNYLGGGDTLALYDNELESIKVIIRKARYSRSVGLSLHAVLAEQAQLAGWAAFDAGNTSYAETLFDMSHTAATRAEDAGLTANACALLAYQRASAGRPDIEVAEASCAELDSTVSPQIRSLVWERLAFTYAVCRRASDAQRALGEAEKALGDDGPKAPDWAAWVDADEISIMTGRVWAELRRPLRAIPALTQAILRMDDTFARDKALYMTWLAEAYVDGGEHEEAQEILQQSIRLADGVSSPRPLIRVESVQRRLAS